MQELPGGRLSARSLAGTVLALPATQPGQTWDPRGLHSDERSLFRGCTAQLLFLLMNKCSLFWVVPLCQEA